MNADERHAALEDVQTASTKAMDNAATAIDNKPSRSQVAKIATIIALVVTLFGVGIAVAISSLAFGETARLSAQQQQDRADAQKNQQLAEQAYTAAQQANATLTARGQAPVSVPSPTEADPTQTIVAAAAAQVLAKLPKQTAVGPTPDSIAAAVAEYLVLNPPGPSVAQISGAVATYLAAHPPAAGKDGANGADGAPGTDGKDGDTGPQGPPPTDAQIQAAFVAYIQANPGFLSNQLCAAYGQNWSQATSLIAADGTRYTLYGCITDKQPGDPPVVAPTTTTSGIFPPGGN